MSKTKLFSLLAVLTLTATLTAFAYSYDVKIPVAGKSIASEKLQKDSLFTIYSFAMRAANPSCQSFQIIDTNITKPKADGAWEEVWSIRACEQKINVPVLFTEANGKGTYYVNPMGVKHIMD